MKFHGWALLLIISLSWIYLAVCDNAGGLIEDSLSTNAPTAPSSPNTTTGAPSSPTTTGVPKPTTTLPPEPKASLWYVTDNVTNNTCILMEAGIRMTFNYKNSSGQMIKDHMLDIPKDGVVVGGSCTNPAGHTDTQQTITLAFFQDWMLSLTLTLNQTEKKYDVSSVSLVYRVNPQQFPGAVKHNTTTSVKEDNMEMFMTDMKRKYVCVSSQTLMSKNDSKLELTSITTYTLSLEAFRNSTSHVFTANANHCTNDEVSQLVPIIVGAALAGLIILVLIAYLIGRQKVRRGYESV